jgi:endonuclease/exonuclease/phosphatase (EEP) superfamily protein YafD
MDQIKDEIISHEGPVLYAGDFNTRTSTRTRYVKEQMKQLNFKEVEFIDGHHRMTWPLSKNYLDLAFVRGLEVRHALVIKDSKGSDHKPMIMELKLPSSQLASYAQSSP